MIESFGVILDGGTTNNFGDTESGGLAGPTGLVIILFLIVGTVLLIRNMNGRLRRLPASFDPPTPPATDVHDVDDTPAQDPAAPRSGGLTE